jgi:hypothetical protein
MAVQWLMNSYMVGGKKPTPVMGILISPFGKETGPVCLAASCAKAWADRADGRNKTDCKNERRDGMTKGSSGFLPQL